MLSIVGWRYNSVVPHVFCMHEALDSILSTKKEKKNKKEKMLSVSHPISGHPNWKSWAGSSSLAIDYFVLFFLAPARVFRMMLAPYRL